MKFSEETLIAYVDGELDAGTRAEVERASAADPELAVRIARHRSLREALRCVYDPMLDEPVPERLLAAVRAAPATASPIDDSPPSSVIRLRGVRAQSTRRWTIREWGAIAASLVLGAVVSSVAIRSFDAAPLSTRGGQLVAAGALANALSDRLASQQAPGSRVTIGMTFVAKSGDYCRTFTLHDRLSLAGLACRAGSHWHVEVLAASEPRSEAIGSYRQAASSISPVILAAMKAEISGDPLDAREEGAARAKGWKR